MSADNICIDQWISQNLPAVLSREIERMEADLRNASVKMYWAGTVLRIDIKPKTKKQEEA